MWTSRKKTTLNVPSSSKHTKNHVIHRQRPHYSLSLSLSSWQVRLMIKAKLGMYIDYSVWLNHIFLSTLSLPTFSFFLPFACFINPFIVGSWDFLFAHLNPYNLIGRAAFCNWTSPFLISSLEDRNGPGPYSPLSSSQKSIYSWKRKKEKPLFFYYFTSLTFSFSKILFF